MTTKPFASWKHALAVQGSHTGAVTQEPWKQASWTIDIGGFQNQCWASLLRNTWSPVALAGG